MTVAEANDSMTATTVQTAKMAAVRSTVLLGDFRLSIEHGWLCMRTATGWLMLERKLSEIPPAGIALDEIETEVRRRLPVCDCGGEPHRDHCQLVELGLIPSAGADAPNTPAQR